MSRHIGIVACSAVGAALCYRTICTEAGDGYDHPEVSMHTHSLGEYMRRIERDDWAAVGELMLSSAEKLAAAGADFLICPDNTIHQALPLIEMRLPRPWLHIADVVADAARERRFTRLALTGTRSLVESDVYPKRLAARGIDVVRPDAEERAEIDRIIFEELVHGRLTEDARASLQRTIARLRDDGCEAVILGCTELPLILDEARSPLPALDSTRLLARAALRRASEAG